MDGSPYTVTAPQSRCRFGVARADITPPADIYQRMWGAARHDQAEGIHRPLTATALYLAPLEPSDGDPLVLVALDHCLLYRREAEAVTAQAVAAAGAAHPSLTIKPGSLQLVFSHTHAAGLMAWDRSHLPGGERIRPYLEEMATKIGQAIAAAAQAAEPATLVYGSGRCSLAAHRDLWDERSGQFVCGFNPQGPADDTVLVARATDDDCRLLATLVNYACHPTTLAWDNRLISPDFPGAMRETVEAALGAPCVFLQGASGDLGPREGFVGDLEVADRNGRILGHAAVAALESLPPAGKRFDYTGPVISGATIGTWAYRPLDAASLAAAGAWQLRQCELPLPCREDLPTIEDVQAQREQLFAREQAARQAGDQAAAADARALIERTDRMITRLSVLDGRREFAYRFRLLKVGHAFWLAAPGEPYQDLQVQLRRRFPGVAIVVMGLAGAWGPSYLPPRDVYGRGIYQESIALLAPGSLERLIEAAGDAIETMLAQP